MLKRLLILLILALAQFGCSIEEGGGDLQPRSADRRSQEGAGRAQAGIP
jgi:hypothetical protein